MGRAGGVVRRERIIGRNCLEWCEPDAGGQSLKGEATLLVVVIQSHLSL